MHISMALPVMDKAHGDHHVGPGSVQASPLSVLLTIPDSQTILEDDILQHTSLMRVCVCVRAYSQIKNCQTSMPGVVEGTMESWSHTSSCNNQISTNNQFHLAVYHNFQRFQTVLCLCGEDFCSPIFPERPPMRRTMATFPR